MSPPPPSHPITLVEADQQLHIEHQLHTWCLLSPHRFWKCYEKSRGRRGNVSTGLRKRPCHPSPPLPSPSDAPPTPLFFGICIMGGYNRTFRTTSAASGTATETGSSPRRHAHQRNMPAAEKGKKIRRSVCREPGSGILEENIYFLTKPLFQKTMRQKISARFFGFGVVGFLLVFFA